MTNPTPAPAVSNLAASNITKPNTPTTDTTAIVTGSPRKLHKRRRVEPIYYFFLVPTLILFTLAITVPGVMGIFFSFTDSIGIGEWSFNGLTNYIAMFSDPSILQSYLFTFGFSIATVIVVNVIAFMLAVGLTSRIRFKTGLRTIFVIPMVISGIIIAYVFNFLFSNSIPAAGAATGIPWLETSLLANPDLAWVAIVIVTAWQATPGTLLIYIAGLLSVPGDVYEAASIDGASKTQQLLRITVPLVAGYVVINVILGFKGFLNAYDIIVGLTNGGPGTATRSVAMTIIAGFNGGDYAYQMANATIFFIVAVLISLLQLSLTRGRNAL
ncbi:carbohydrate ABC transporter permease [Microbacterium sp. NPDC089696]|uniref:carbohydrate ABC transporter permease n=1 Tax=Microbacterium sp. NPDC089696 TaxID=3364199 RepID=UPI003805C826